MESPSAKTPEVFQNTRKLKQATLPFETIKVSSKNDTSFFKRQIIHDCNTQQVPQNFENTQLTEVVDLEDVECERNIHNKIDADEIVPQTVCEVQLEEENDCKESIAEINETEIIKNEDVASVVLPEPPKEIKPQCLSEVVHENFSSQEVNLASGKRKLKSNEEPKGQKPPKRAKLIYHVDKIKKDNVISGSEMELISAKSKNADNVNSVDVKSCEVDCQVNLKPNLLCRNLGEGNNLKDKCSTDCLITLDDSENQEICSLETDIDSDKKECATPNSKKTGLLSVRRLTPKQLEKKAASIRKKENLQQEKEKKRKQKEEEKVRIKQEKEEFRKKVREEKQKKRQAEIELKSAEKRRREERRRKKREQKLEDKRRKEEQKLEDRRKKEELMRKKEEEGELMKKKITKEAEAFSNFFKKCDVKTHTIREDSSLSSELIFMPFTVKADMRLAPINRNPMDNDRLSKFEKLYNAQSEMVTYLEELRSGKMVPEKRSNTWPLEEKYDEDLVVLDEGLDLKNETTTVPQKKFSDRRPKLLQFYENRRPPYWGTWRKKSETIRPKNPLGKDEIFDYEVDSDDEWEEEEPGESLHGSDDEKESEDEYEVDNDFFVPHGYLSDDENPEEEIISPETQKAKLKLLGEQFDLERSEKTKLLKPITLGCIWFNSCSDEPPDVNPAIVKFLNKRKAVPWTDSIPISLIQDENLDSSEAAAVDNDTPTSNKKASFPVAAIPDLIAFIHKSTNSRKNLAKMFVLHWTKKEDKTNEGEENALTLSQASVTRKIKELANWEEFPESGPCNGRKCWYVKKDIREKFGVGDILINNSSDISDAKDFDGSKKVSPPLITKFTKVLTEDERWIEMTKSSTRKSSSNSLPEKTSSNPKSEYKTLKCVKKLREFLAKTSVNENYSSGDSISSEKVNENVVVSPPQENNCSTILPN